MDMLIKSKGGEKMVDIKEIKSVELAPFTLMSSSIHAILAFIMAILMLIAFGTIALLIPQFKAIGAAITWLGVALIIIYPISAFFINIAASFFGAFLYNTLVPRLGGIKLGLEGNEVAQIPVVSFALILASIETIWAFIIGLFFAAALAPLFAFLSTGIAAVSGAINSTLANGTFANATNASGAMLPTGSLVATGGVISALILIIGLPIAVFIIGFITNALAAIFYNFLAVRVAKIKLELAPVAGNSHALNSIPVVPAALSISIVGLVFGIINGILSLNIGTFIGDIIMYFIGTFIVVALIAIFYNFLAPRIGAVKLGIE
jgi:hypothetical protein